MEKHIMSSKDWADRMNLRFPLILLAFSCSFSMTSYGQVQEFLNTDFEGSSSRPAGWTESWVSGETDSAWAFANGGINGADPDNAHGGTRNARFFYSSTSDTKRRLITPVLDTTGYTNIKVDFWHTQHNWNGWQDHLKVFYSSNSGTNWTEIASYTADVQEWTLRSLDIPASGSGIQVAFEGNAHWGRGVCLDDIVVAGIADNLSEVTVSATDASAAELGQDPGTWTITRSGNTSGSLSVNYSLSGSATVVSDYNVDDSSPIVFGDGETTKVVTLTPVDDSEGSEDVEVATLTLTSGTGYVIDRLPVSDDISIVDDEGFDLNILIIGSTRSYSETGESGIVHEKEFDPTAIASHLESIIDQDAAITNTVKVAFEDIYTNKTMDVAVGGGGTLLSHTLYCFSLMQYYMWPEGKSNRLANLRGEMTALEYDYVIIMGDPYLMANMPGVFAEGVGLLANEIEQGSAEPILFAQWPENASTFTASNFNEVVYRVGDSAGLRVVPGGTAWQDYGSQDTSTNHPTPDGAYLAAAAIYSELYDRSAKTSGYTYVDSSKTTEIADHALSVVQTNRGASQYSGIYTNDNVFQMEYGTMRHVKWGEHGSSTEEGFAGGVTYAFGKCNIDYTRSVPNGGNIADFSYSRATDVFTDGKQYDEQSRLNYDNHTFGFPMGDHGNTGAETMRYGIDIRYDHTWGWGFTAHGTDLGVANAIILSNQVPMSVRGVPVRLLWSKMHHADLGFSSHRDSWHLSRELDRAVGAFMLTSYSGRCPVDDEPSNPGSTDWNYWYCARLGYEAAWRMSHLTTRAPGFRVLPTADTGVTNVTHSNAQTLSVRFMMAPTSDVSVVISVDDPLEGSVDQSVLNFTTSNYSNEQVVTVMGQTGLAGTNEFNVQLQTISDDPVYDELTDTWNFVNTASGLTLAHQVSVQWLTDVLGITNDFEAAVTNDTDADGFTAAQEFWAGTDPGSSNSHLIVSDISSTVSNVNLVWWHSNITVATPQVLIQRSESLNPAVWTNVAIRAGTNGLNSWYGPELTGPSYYRLAITNMP